MVKKDFKVGDADSFYKRKKKNLKNMVWHPYLTRIPLELREPVRIGGEYNDGTELGDSIGIVDCDMEDYDSWEVDEEEVNIVYYSYKVSEHDHINEHELNRLEHSISSLREFNNEIPVYLFCDDLTFIPINLIIDLSIRVEPFVDAFNATVDYTRNRFQHRWFNLGYFKERDHNILYVDADTIFYEDVQYIFDTYTHYDVYGREEFGFRHDPNHGGGRNIRKQLDWVDKCIADQGGVQHVYKYCTGVMLLNNNFHQDLADRFSDLRSTLDQLLCNAIPYPVPNPRIIDQYAFWIVLSRMAIYGGLFGIQDVTMGYKEQKHQENFYPVICHYTTKGEQALARSNKKYSNLLRDVDELGEEIDPYSVV